MITIEKSTLQKCIDIAKNEGTVYLLFCNSNNTYHYKEIYARFADGHKAFVKEAKRLHRTYLSDGYKPIGDITPKDLTKDDTCITMGYKNKEGDTKFFEISCFPYQLK